MDLHSGRVPGVSRSVLGPRLARMLALFQGRERPSLQQAMRILGIESSCDETAAAVVRDGREILSSVIASQIDLHRPWGGVVPELASREHLDKIEPVVTEALDEAKITLADIDAIAVTQGPGLIGSLL